MNIDVRKELGVIEMPARIFIKPQGADKLAAATRLATTEKMFEQWHADINRTNMGDVPKELIEAYEAAAVQLCVILMMERQIVSAKV